MLEGSFDPSNFRGTAAPDTDNLVKRQESEFTFTPWNVPEQPYAIPPQQTSISRSEHAHKRTRIDEHGAYYPRHPSFFAASGLPHRPPPFSPWLRAPRHSYHYAYSWFSASQTFASGPSAVFAPGPHVLNHSFSCQPLSQTDPNTNSGYILPEPPQIAVPPQDQTPSQSRYTEENPDVSDVVCYGALDRIDEVQINLDRDPCQLTVSWDGSSQLHLDYGRKVDLSPRCAAVLRTLADEAAASFDFELAAAKAVTNDRREQRQHRPQPPDLFDVSAVVYGLRQAVDAVGSWLDAAELYLQVPTCCTRDVPYCNPHAMVKPANRVVMTREFFKANKASHQNDNKVDTDALRLNPFAPRSYQEAAQPTLVTSELHSHQLQGLTFMQGRELGWDLHNERNSNDLWRSNLDRFGRERYVQTLSHESRFKPPTQFRGGILADEMGLGKTCTMLSLIAADLESYDSAQASTEGAECPTLIIVPLPLLQVWEKQIKEHLLPDCVVLSTYYGPATKLNVTFDSCDIVLTTYNTVSRQWKSLKKTALSETKPPLFATRWRRIVLDEAHVIKNKGTDVAKAVTALEGDRRWCITGTPIQNRSMDIYSLLRFLKVYPYDDFKVFESTFVEPWVMNADESALEKLQVLVSTITLRRPRSTISLPDREEVFCSVTFSTDELELYEKAKRGAFQSIDAAFSSSGNVAGASYLNALQRINDMRYICNHGTQPRPTKERKEPLASKEEDLLIERELKMMFAENSDSICANCGYDLLEDQEEENDTLRVMCRRKPQTDMSICKHCGVETGISRAASPATPSLISDLRPNSPCGDTETYVSSKIQSLVLEIQKIGTGDKCVVFSYWTNTLKTVGKALGAAKIPFLLYDGSMSRIKRDSILRSFCSNPHTKVILVSITCGGQGLDLTVANHAFLIEPQWNPKLEEQAMARVHRLGQKKAVRLVRLVVKDTWEEKIVTLQERKKLLADLIVDSKRVAEGSEGRKQLTWLRDLVS